MQGNIDTTQQPMRLEDARAMRMQDRPDEGGVTLHDMQPEMDVGRHGPVGHEEISKAEQLLKDYKAGKANLEARVVENEQWYKGRHWGVIKKQGGKVNAGDPEPASAWLLNSIANKHADAMDNYPEPNVLPREQADEQDAKLLSDVIPVVLEQNDYQTVYSNVWWDKLKSGTGVTGVFWDSKKDNGLGDIDIRPVDLLQLYWEPGITDLQKSTNLFHVELVDKELLKQRYPFLTNALASDTLGKTEYLYDDTVDTTKKTLVVDWYYKQNDNGRDVVHFCKYAGGEVIYASENDPEYAERGYYDHGKYPFVMDPLFPVKGTPCGFGYIDVCKSPQLYIDKLDQAMLKHAVFGARQRYWVRGDGKINEQEFADPTHDLVHYYGSGNPNDDLVPIVVPDIGSSFMDMRTLKVEEMKETSSNRDFSQGGTASGVTAASAIAALQEAGSKTSRDMIKASYNAFVEICYLVIELMRQFYREDRYFRIIGDQGAMEFVRFNGAQIAAKPQGNDFGLDTGYRVPIFDIKVTSQKSSPFSTVAQNERAKELYGMGFFRPDLADQALAALDMMDFEGIEKVRQRISENGTLYQTVMQMQQQMMQLAAIVDKTQGSQILPAMTQEFAMQAQQDSGRMSGQREAQTDSLGNAFNAAKGSTAGKAREQAAQVASPR